jgi:superfamily I DNA/RNA helicase
VYGDIKELESELGAPGIDISRASKIGKEISELRSLGQAMVDCARDVIGEMSRWNGRFPVSHDFYLREFVASKPDLSQKFDYILFDEAQDADPLMLELTQAQNIPVFYVGDQFQQIYDWRGAKNAMESLAIPEAFLTQSFRFGPKIAADANLLLKDLGSRVDLRGLNDIKSTVEECSDVAEMPDAIITRYNREAIGYIARFIGKAKIGIRGKTAMMSTIRDLESLENGEPRGEFIYFQDFKEFEDYTEKYDQSLNFLLKMYRDYGPKRVAQVFSQAIDVEAEAWQPVDMIITTAHKAKGLEWPSVFLSPGLFGKQVAPEMRLRYVAKTRAKMRLMNSRRIDDRPSVSGLVATML